MSFSYEVIQERDIETFVLLRKRTLLEVPRSAGNKRLGFERENSLQMTKLCRQDTETQSRVVPLTRYYAASVVDFRAQATSIQKQNGIFEVDFSTFQNVPSGDLSV